MKKILVSILLCSHAFSMNNNSQTTSLETRMQAVENSIADHNSRLNNINSAFSNVNSALSNVNSELISMSGQLNTFKIDTNQHLTLIDTKLNDVDNRLTIIENKLEVVDQFSTALEELSSTISDVIKQMAEMQITLSTLDMKYNEKLENTWDVFVNQKFDEYMQVKKKVLDVISSCKAQGEPTPTYIVETAEQLQLCSLDTRRALLTEIIEKLNVFAFLLNGEKIEALQNYLTVTTVPESLEIKEIMPLSGIIIDGDYIKITGALRDFIRKTPLGTGVPHESWMDINYDYFGYKRLSEIKTKITTENADRKIRNEANQAAHDAAINAANRVELPADELDSLISDYNRLLTRHEI